MNLRIIIGLHEIKTHLYARILYLERSLLAMTTTSKFHAKL